MKKRRQCQHVMDDLTKCTSFAMNGSDFCYRHNPDISDEEKINASSLGGKSNSQPEFIETPLPEIKIEKYQDIVSVLADTINNVRSGKISQKSGSTIGYLSFIMLMAVDKAKAEAKEEKIEKLKAEGRWRPEPKFDTKYYMYKDEYYLDKDGNRLIVENDGTNRHPEKKYKYEDENIKTPKPRKRKSNRREALHTSPKSHTSHKSHSSNIPESQSTDECINTIELTDDMEHNRQVINAFRSRIVPDEDESNCRDALHASGDDENGDLEHEKSPPDENDYAEGDEEGNEPELQPCGSFD